MKNRNLILIIILLNTLSSFSQKNKNANPLLQEWKTPYGVPPFNLIKTEHFLPAFEEAMKQNNKNIENIISNTETPNFKNTIEAIENSSELLTKISSVFYNQLSSNTNPEMQRVAKEIAPILSKHNDEINLNPKLFAKIKFVYENQKKEKLNSEQIRLLEKYYKDFIRNGSNLKEEDKEYLKKINSELSILTLKFGDNLLSETNKFKLVIEDKNSLEGVPDFLLQSAQEEAKKNNIPKGYLFTLQKTSIIPFLQYVKHKELRSKIYFAYTNRCNNNDEFDNKELIKKIVNLRFLKANWLGYKNHAHYILEKNMAQNADKVYELLKQLIDPALNKANHELTELQNIANNEGNNTPIESSDWWYYAEKYKMINYKLNEEELKEYFKLENVRDGIFAVSNKLYGLKFIQNKKTPLTHPDATFFEVKEADGTLLGVLYMDFFPRQTKKSGAWCTSFRTAHYKNNKRVIPIVSIVCNFSKPTKDKPALLNLDEVETFFHEFGHAIHSLLSNCQYRGSVSTPRDFVELPSQIMENWAFEPQVLKMYAKHYKTNKVIPEELISNLTNSSKFNQGFATVEYLYAAFLDMKYHTIRNEEGFQIEEFENALLFEINALKEIVPRYRSTYFQHIFAGGYSAGYYSYIWSEVLDSDAFAAFKESGDIFNTKIADSFRKNILEKGNSADPYKMYISFRGAEPNVKYLINKRGLE